MTTEANTQTSGFFATAFAATLRFFARAAGYALNLFNAAINSVAKLFGYKTEGMSEHANPAPINTPVEIKPSPRGQAQTSGDTELDGMHSKLQEAFKDAGDVQVVKLADKKRIDLLINQPDGKTATLSYQQQPITKIFRFLDSDHSNLKESFKTYGTYLDPKEMRKSIEKYLQHRGRLIGDTPPKQETIDSGIAQLKKAFKDRTDARFTEASEAERSQGHFYTLTIKRKEGDEIWYLDAIREADDYNPIMARFTKKDSPGSAMHIPMGGLLTDAKVAVMSSLANRTPTLDKADYILQYASEIQRDLASEQQDAANVKSFDLPKDKPIGYLAFNGMGSTKDKSNFGDDIENLHAFPEAMKQCGYQMVCRDDAQRVIDLKDVPADTIKNNIKVLYDAGVRDFYLKFSVHGSALGMHPTHTGLTGNSYLSSGALQDILHKYGDCRFTIDSTACYGGGLSEMMRDFKDAPEAQPGRVNVFMHTKERIYNYEYYGDHMMQELKKMAESTPDAAKTYGEAHQRVDKAVKQRITPAGSIDAEYWKSMPDAPSLRTADASDAMKDAIKKAHSDYTPIGSGEVASHSPLAATATVTKDKGALLG